MLTEERAVVGKTTEPVERVKLGTETVTDEETVTEEVRKEHIEAEGDVDDRRGTGEHQRGPAPPRRHEGDDARPRRCARPAHRRGP